MIRVCVVDDDPIVVRSLETILSSAADIQVVGTGTSAADAVWLWHDCRPDVLLCDIQMPGVDSISAAEQILAAEPGARIVFLTTFSDDEYIVRALRAGAAGYLIKQDVRSVAPALRAVMAGQRVLEGEVLDRAVLLSARGDKSTPDGDAALVALTEREREVVRAVSDGLDNAEIARTLYMSEGTLRNHISAILAKLGLRNRTQLAVYYWKRCR